MESKQERRRWKNFLVDKRYQLYYTGAWIFMIALALVNYVAVSLLIEDAAPRADRAFFAVLQIVSKANAILLIAAAGWLGWLSVLHSHRLAGAVFSINRTLARVLEGDESAEVRIRKGDFSSELADRTNQLIRRLRERGERLEALGAARDSTDADDSP